jgi:hypothetical protein
MSYQLNSDYLQIATTGGAYNVDLTSLSSSVIVGFATPAPYNMTGSVTIAPAGTPKEGTSVTIYLPGNIKIGVPTFTIFGVSIPASLINNSITVYCYYIGGAWSLSFVPSFLTGGSVGQTVDTASIVGSAVTTVKINDGAVTTVKINDGAVSTAKIADDAVTTIKIDDDAVTTIKIDDDAVTAAKLSTQNKKYPLVVEVSFESNEVGANNSILMPHDGKVKKIYWQVIHTIAGSNDATVTPKNNAGTTMTGGLITITQSSALNTEGEVTTTANNTFVAGDYLDFVTAKTTAGGKARLVIEVERT